MLIATRVPSPITSRLFGDPDASILHLAAIAFQANRAGFGQLERGLQHLAITRAMSDAVLYDDHHFVPVLRFVFLQLFIGPRQRIVATLKLRLADEHPAVGVGSRAKIQLEREILRKLARRPKLSDFSPFRR